MKYRHAVTLLAACLLIAAAACGDKNEPTARAVIESRSGSTATGNASFVERSGGVEVVVEVSNTPPGLHAVHVHERGDCSAADASSAGAHFNPTNMQHGAPGSGPHHAGDFGNITVSADGRGRLELRTTELKVSEGTNSVVGRGLIVHANPDDFVTQPTGNAGGRIGCGVIR